MNELDFSIVVASASYLARGLEFSLALTAVAFAAGLLLGTTFALIQHFRIPGLSQIVRAYIVLVRSIPLILVLFWFFFLVPVMLGWIVGAHGRPVPVGPNVTAFITFSLFEAAYYSEIIRVGLRSVEKGQYEACRALSLSTFDTYASIVMPQVFRITSPIILSQTIILFQPPSSTFSL
jgi:glutamate/aspartate transport system permease protein